jgi:hypothetical protein
MTNLWEWLIDGKGPRIVEKAISTQHSAKPVKMILNRGFLEAIGITRRVRDFRKNFVG